MSLTKDQRIKVTEKMVAVPAENAMAEGIKDTMEEEKAKLEPRDQANKTLGEDQTFLINKYQKEISKYDGNDRTEVVEQDFIDSADRVLQNPFFPNDPLTPTPSLPQGVWTFLNPFAGNKAIGKTYLEVWDIIDGELPLIGSISSEISVIEAFHVMERCTGQFAEEAEEEEGGGGGGGGGSEVFPFPAMQDASNTVIDYVEKWKIVLEALLTLIFIDDPDAGRAAENVTAKEKVQNTLDIIQVWLDLDTFDTGHGQTTYADFYAYDVSLLNPVKFRTAELLPLKDLLSGRTTEVNSRVSQINGHLGEVVQDIADGSITSKSGFYGNRYGFIELRLNVMGGTLSAIKSLEQGQDSQDKIQDSNNSALDTYGSLIKVTTFRSPAVGTKIIHVMDGTGFNEGDDIYIVGDQLDEIESKILKKEVNTIYLDKDISKKYTRDVRSRIYKMS